MTQQHIQPPETARLELGSDGIIRDADSGEHYGYVPLSMRPLYGAAAALLHHCKTMLVIVETITDDSTLTWVKQTIREAEGR